MKEVTDLGSDPRLSTNPVLSEGNRQGFLKEGAPEQVLRVGRIWPWSSEEKSILGRSVGVSV